MSKKSHLIAHLIDLDGVSCHAIGERAFPHKFQHHDIVYGAEFEPWEIIQPGQEIYFCDLGYSERPSMLKMIKRVRELKNGGSNIHFFDHHPWPQNLINELFTTSSHNQQKSSTPLLVERLLPQDEMAQYIANLCYNDDRNITTDPMAQYLTMIINSGYNPLELALHMAKATKPNELVPKNSLNYINFYHKENFQAKKKLKSTYETQYKNGYKINTGLAPKFLYLKPGHRLMKEDHKSGINLCFFEGYNNVMFRAQDEDTFNMIISIFDGGGRENEGGFNLEKIVTSQNYHSIKDDVLQRIKEYGN